MEDKVSYGIFDLIRENPNDDVNVEFKSFSCWYTNFDDAYTETVYQRSLEQNKEKVLVIIERNESFTIIEG